MPGSGQISYAEQYPCQAWVLQILPFTLLGTSSLAPSLETVFPEFLQPYRVQNV